MLRIRLQRTGRSKRPQYRIVVAEHSAPIKGRYVEQIGFYNPLSDPEVFEFDKEKVESWVKKGARPTNTVARLLKKQGVKGMERFIVEMVDRKVKNPSEEEEAPAPETAPAEGGDAEQKSEDKPAEAKEESKEEDKEAEKKEESKEDEESKDESDKKDA